MRYFYVEPEVAGGFGKNTIMDRSVHPPIVSKLHYEFDGWLGDSILESFPCFIITETLKDVIVVENLKGAEFADVIITKSEQFRDLYPNKELPIFIWLKITGKPGCDDFGVDIKGVLVLSEKALMILKNKFLTHAIISEFNNNE